MYLLLNPYYDYYQILKEGEKRMILSYNPQYVTKLDNVRECLLQGGKAYNFPSMEEIISTDIVINTTKP